MIRFSGSLFLGLAAMSPLAATAQGLTNVPRANMIFGEREFVIPGYALEDARFPAAVEYEGAMITLDCGPESGMPPLKSVFMRTPDDMPPLIAEFKYTMNKGTDSEDTQTVATFAYKSAQALNAEDGDDSYYSRVTFDITGGAWGWMCKEPKLKIDLRTACMDDLGVVFDLNHNLQGKFRRNTPATGFGRLQTSCPDAVVKADYYVSVNGEPVVGDTMLMLTFDLSACTLDGLVMIIDSDRRQIGPGMCVTGGDGDPHIKTWGGKFFDYMGECDILLLEDEDFDGQGNDLMIQTRNTIRYDYSFIEAAAVKLGDDVLEVRSYGDYSLNGIGGARMNDDKVGEMSGYPVYHTQVNKKKHTFDIVLSPTTNITLGSFKDLVAVHLDNARSHVFFKNLDTKGIMGSFDGKLMARDGETEMEDLDAFGQEWQVRDTEPMLFAATREPQYPAACKMPTPELAAEKKRRLGQGGISRDVAEAACSRHGSAGTPAFENCVYDVMAVGDLEMASAGAA